MPSFTSAGKKGNAGLPCQYPTVEMMLAIIFLFAQPFSWPAFIRFLSISFCESSGVSMLLVLYLWAVASVRIA
jgi:hypothetical protein